MRKLRSKGGLVNQSHTLILIQLGQQQYSLIHVLIQPVIALTIACAITGHTRTNKSTDYYPNCTQKCVINYTNFKFNATIIIVIHIL